MTDIFCDQILQAVPGCSMHPAVVHMHTPNDVTMQAMMVSSAVSHRVSTLHSYNTRQHTVVQSHKSPGQGHRACCKHTTANKHLNKGGDEPPADNDMSEISLSGPHRQSTDLQSVNFMRARSALSPSPSL